MGYDLVKKGNSYFHASKNLLLGLITKHYSSRSLDLLTANKQTSNKLGNTASTRLRSLLALYQLYICCHYSADKIVIQQKTHEVTKVLTLLCNNYKSMETKIQDIFSPRLSPTTGVPKLGYI